MLTLNLDVDKHILSLCRTAALTTLLQVNKSCYNFINQITLFHQRHTLYQTYSTYNQPDLFLIVFNDACARDYLELFIYLSKRHAYLKSWLALTDAFRVCCMYGRIRIAKVIIRIAKTEICALIGMTNTNNDWCAIRDTPMWLCCYHGQFDMAKWLYDDNNFTDATVCRYKGTDMYEYFLAACRNGHIDIAKWLVTVTETWEYGKIDVHRQLDKVFRLVVQNGHVDVMLWLVDLCNNRGYGRIKVGVIFSLMLAMAYVKRVSRIGVDEGLLLLKKLTC